LDPHPAPARRGTARAPPLRPLQCRPIPPRRRPTPLPSRRRGATRLPVGRRVADRVPRGARHRHLRPRVHPQAGPAPRTPDRGAPTAPPRGPGIPGRVQRDRLPTPRPAVPSGSSVCGPTTNGVRCPPRPPVPLRMRSARRRSPTLWRPGPRGVTRSARHPRGGAGRRPPQHRHGLWGASLRIAQPRGRPPKTPTRSVGG
jgi:hypothetical protein